MTIAVKNQGVIVALAKAEGLTPSAFVKRIVEESGSILRAAIRLEVSPNTVRYWLHQDAKRDEAKQA